MARLFVAASSQYLEVNVAAVTVAPFTLAAWAMSNDTTLGNQQIISIGDKDVTDEYWSIGFSGDLAGDPVSFFMQDTANFTSVNSTTGYSANTWHHVCGVEASATSHTVYLDGGSSATSTANRSPDNVDRTSIGRRATSAGVGYMSGRIAEAAIWNIALTAAQVGLLAKGISPLRIRPDALVAYWPLFGNASPEINLAKGTTSLNLTVTGATQADHIWTMPAFGFDAGWRGAFTAAAAVTGWGPLLGGERNRLVVAA